MIAGTLQFFTKTRIMLILCAVFSLLTAYFAMSGSTSQLIIIPLLFVAAGVVYAVVKFPQFGVMCYLIFAYCMSLLAKIGVNFPLGTIMDGMLVLLILGFFIEQKVNKNWKVFQNSISLIIIIWILYNVLQFVNPTAESRQAWVYTIRSVAAVSLSYFIFSYHIKTLKFVRLIIRVWLGLSVFAAIYAIKQEYVGFFDFEQRVLDENPLLQTLLFIDGHWRKSSIFTDPVAFSYNMVASSILCISLIFGTRSIKKKLGLGFLAMLFMTVMLYSGTRAAYVLLPAAMVLLAVLKFNKTVFMISCIGGFMMLVLINIPTGNPTLYRFQSAFKPANDASYSVRQANQKRIQPYIKSHPLGGGLGATGVWGVRFAPNSFLAQFPPDSGFVRVAVELGFIGLFLICALMFIILKTGIENYFKIEDPELKSYSLAMVLILFAVCIGNFPQEAIVQYPLSVYFYMAVALINILPRLEVQKAEQLKLEKNGAH